MSGNFVVENDCGNFVVVEILMWLFEKKALLLLFENTSANANPAATAPCIDRGIEEEHFSLWVNRTQAATAMLVAA